MQVRHRKKYPSKTYIDTRVELRKSPIHKRGIFAKAPIKEGEIVIVGGGKLFTKDEIKKGKARKYSETQIDDNLYLAAPHNEPPTIGDYVNHSCDPTLWLADEVTLIARRDIKVGGELTFDYGTEISNPAIRLKCNCGSTNCRCFITSEDWKRTDLQKRYKGHFVPYLERKIAKLK